MRTSGISFPRSTHVSPRNTRSAPSRPHSLHEWQDFSHRLHEAGHQPYCLVW
ncbi:hypothetical protein GT002_21910, partial [Streptomyces sp. SID4917]|nr:hypothetical protein [Streptomyces sp. SID4917]